MDPSVRTPLLVELVGPAGAGKSTVFEALLSRNETIEGRPVLRTRENATVLGREVLATLGILLRQRAPLRRLNLEQVRMMAYLQAFPRILRRGDSARERILVFDQGPLYFLTRPSLMNARLARWRERMLDTWAPLLDIVVWLEAPDPVLIERINSRAKWHRLKGSFGPAALDVLTTSRRVYEDALSDVMERGHRPTLLRFDTSRRSADEVAEGVIAELRRSVGHAPTPG